MECFSDIENLHITLRFLGEMQQNKIKMVCDVLSVIQNRVFELECNGIGIFDGKDIVFAKLGGDLQDLFLLYEKIENALEKSASQKKKGLFGRTSRWRAIFNQHAAKRLTLNPL